MDRESVVQVATDSGLEPVHVLSRQGQRDDHRFLVWHGFDSVNRFYSWDWLLPFGDVVRVGLPGHGPVARQPDAHYRRWTSSYFTDLAGRIVRLLGHGRPLTVLGHSAGTQFALGAALSAPAEVARLILVNPVVWPRYSRLAQRLMRSSLWPLIGTGILARDHRRKRRSVAAHLAAKRPIVFDHQAFSGNPRTRMFVEQGFADYRRTPLPALVALARVLGTNDLRPAILARPPSQEALIVHGRQDRLCPIAQSRWLVQQLPRARLLELDRVGHIGYAEREADFASGVCRWLAVTAGAQPAGQTPLEP